jgi:hypothetical protein
MLIKRGTDETKFHQQEDSPLLDSVSENTSLSFYHFLHPIMLGLVFSVLVISSILSAIETVLHICHGMRNITAN